MKLHSGCRRAAALPSVCGQMIYVVLVTYLVGSGPAAIQRMSHLCYILFSMLPCQSYL